MQPSPYKCPPTSNSSNAREQWQQVWSFTSSTITRPCTASFWGLGLVPFVAAVVGQAWIWRSRRRRSRFPFNRPHACPGRSQRDNGVVHARGAARSHEHLPENSDDRAGGDDAGTTFITFAATQVAPQDDLPHHVHPTVTGGGATGTPAFRNVRGRKAMAMDSDHGDLHAPLIPPSLPPSHPPFLPCSSHPSILSRSVLFAREILLLLHLLYVTYCLLTLLDPAFRPSSDFSWQHALAIRLSQALTWTLVLVEEEKRRGR
ncbi:hypothetical protein Naga_101022g1, partial [Nannochloropsis gaditana]